MGSMTLTLWAPPSPSQHTKTDGVGHLERSQSSLVAAGARSEGALPSRNQAGPRATRSPSRCAGSTRLMLGGAGRAQAVVWLEEDKRAQE